MANIQMKTIKFPGIDETYTIPTAPEHVGAKPADWMPTAEEVGAFPVKYVPGGFAAYAVNIGGTGSVRFRAAAYLMMMCRLTGAAATSPSVYAITAYNEYRAPLVTELSVGTNITVFTGGDNTNGWYIEITCNHAAGATVYLFGNCIPNFI